MVNNPPNNAAASTNQTEKTRTIQAQSNEHTSNETSSPTPSVLQPKPNHSSSSLTFPKRNCENQNRSCQPQWFSERHWLDYNEVNDNVTRFICKKHASKLTMEKNKDEAFLSIGFYSWNKATTAFKVYEKSKCHLAAISFEVTTPRCINVIIEMSNESMKASMKKNRKCLIKILETPQFLGRQGLALRGDENDKNSNFIQFFKFGSKDFVKLNQWLEKKN